ncbi:biotin--[acetyl-CoA-carboxylase] ligase [Fulvivirga sp. 29W222]|uniref:Biotin--[acetyl-CoA-carboxylase] ligase n=1 Tax=Fulvivirga marina TaxID=2494733 RepID=A0A937KEH0_9BACT|nr:biotin--[acetyl-CoA-carboxylase] ligase [Fulvivirga marina]MBL6447168.1 biotin--[acetyl-CoA-carboxylase] ligase [Fulvivirga marina]
MYKIPAKTLFLGKKVIFLPTCHSTNDEAAHLLEKHPVMEGTIVITNNQTAGKGQRGNAWLTEPGKNLTFTLVLKPNFLSIVQQFNLNIVISLGIVDYLNSIRKGFQVKWPNDIYYKEQKICGVLIQNVLKSNRIEYTIVGIGLNVNQLKFPEEKAVSLAQVTGEIYDLQMALNSLCEYLEKQYMQLKRGELDALRNEYLNNMYRFGEDHLYKDKEVFQGRITGISEHGLLEIETYKGLRKYNFKEVEFLS